MFKVEITNVESRILNCPSQEVYNRLRARFTMPAPGAEYLHAVKLRNAIRALLKQHPMCGQDIRNMAYKLVSYDKPVRSRLNKCSLYVEEMKFHPGQIAGYLYEYDEKHGSDGLVCLIDEAHVFMTGLLPAVAAFCEEEKLPLVLIDHRTPCPPSLIISYSPVVAFNNEKLVSLRDYQEDVVRVCIGSTFLGLPWPRGVIKQATGCVDASTEYLTMYGWKPINKYAGEEIAQYHEDGTSTFVKPKYHVFPCSQLWHFSTKYGLDQCLSDEHTVLYKAEKSSKHIKSIKFSMLKKQHEKCVYGFSGRFITSFNINHKFCKNEINSLSDQQLRLQVAVIADGYFNLKSKTNRSYVRLKKERKIERLKILLNEANVEFNLTLCKTTGFSVFSFLSPLKLKEYTEEFYMCSQHQLRVICDEVLLWDGDQKSRFSTTSKKSADFIQYAFTATNRRASMYINDRRGEKHYKSIEYSIDITNRILITMESSKNKVKIKPYMPVDGCKYCFTVPTGMLVLRRNNRVFITGNSGKTEIAIALYQCTHLPSVFLVHRKDLLEQAARRFEKYNIGVGRIGDSEFKPSYSTVTVATIQTIWSILKNEDDVRNGPLLTLFENTKQLFADESHLIAGSSDKANIYVKVMGKFDNAYLRWGLTATPFTKDDEYSNHLLMGATGGLLCDVSNDTLIKAGYLTPPRVRMVTVKHPSHYVDPITKEYKSQPTGRGIKWVEVYDYVITSNPIRNKSLVDEINKAPKPCLVLLQRKKQIDYLKNFGISNYAVLTGTDSKDLRLKTIEKLRNGSIDTVIVTTIFDEGVDIPELRSIIMGGGGKSRIKTLQRLGRGLRLAEDKSEVLIVDFIDFNVSTPGWLPAKHSKIRRSHYVQEGFKVEMV